MDTVHTKEILLYAYTHNTFRYIHAHTYYGGQMFHSVRRTLMQHCVTVWYPMLTKLYLQNKNGLCHMLCHINGIVIPLLS